MSASGKSRNRRSEYYQGYFAKSGNSPASLQGKEDRKKREIKETAESAEKPERLKD